MSDQKPDGFSERGIHELYAADPEAADQLLWGRKTDPLSRRGFFRRMGLTAMTTALGAEIVFWDKMPGGLIPAALAQSPTPFQIEGKNGLIVLNDRPINAETPPHLLDDDITSAEHFFVRNNGNAPAKEAINPETWTLEIAGESCEKPTVFTLPELKAKFEHHTYRLQRIQSTGSRQSVDGRCGGVSRMDWRATA
jgi:DMSO/TMAO reductase YedYZ molybdopterin-dependent catalytic subunit